MVQPDPRVVATHLCAWLLLRREDDHLLLARRSGVDYADGLWGPPGGHAGIDEPWSAAAVRETAEEVGVTVDIDDLAPLGVTRYLDGDVHGVDAFFEARTWQGEPRPVSECSEVGWFAVDDLPLDVLPWLPPVLRAHLVDRTWFGEVLDPDPHPSSP